MILNQAADREAAFVGSFHRIDDRGAQALKALKEIGFEHYYQAEPQGCVLYLEGSGDLAVLQSFAKTVNHATAEVLDWPFVNYVENQPQKARDHFFGLCEAKPDLAGFLLCDRLDRALQPTDVLAERMWSRREIENYLCQPPAHLAYAESLAKERAPGELFEPAEIERPHSAMRESIRELAPPLALEDMADPWWRDTKASGDFSWTGCLSASSAASACPI